MRSDHPLRALSYCGTCPDCDDTVTTTVYKRDTYENDDKYVWVRCSTCRRVTTADHEGTRPVFDT